LRCAAAQPNAERVSVSSPLRRGAAQPMIIRSFLPDNKYRLWEFQNFLIKFQNFPVEKGALKDKKLILKTSKILR
jgi:hypothetical protein